jgi:hypothetical protein
MSNHITDHDLERRYLEIGSDDAELAPLEEHLRACPACVDKAVAAGANVDAMRSALERGPVRRARPVAVDDDDLTWATRALVRYAELTDRLASIRRATCVVPASGAPG